MSGSTTVTVMGTTLFDVAARYLDDPARWSDLAELNGVVDPWLTDLTSLELPNR